MTRVTPFEKLLPRAATAIAISAAAVLATAPHLAAAPSGSISGAVSDADGNPLEDICVEVMPEKSVAVTDASGQYSVPALEAGEHTVRYSDCGSSPTYLEQWYRGAPDQSSADTVQVSDGADTVLDPVQLDSGVVVTGQVTDQGDDPIQDILVLLSPDGNGGSVGSTTDSNGVYRAGPVPAGEYTVSFSDTSQDPSWASQYWNGRSTSGSADRLQLDPAVATEVTGVDAVLGQAAAVSGVVTDELGDPIPNTCVVAYEAATQDYLAGAETDSGGSYRIAGLPAVMVLVEFSDCGGRGFSREWFDDSPDSSGAQQVFLAGGSEVTGVDAQLAGAPVISGQVTDGDGNPIEGIWVYFEPDGNGSFESAITDASGMYQSPSLEPSQYRVRFRDESANPPWATEYWDDQLSWDDAQIIDLSGGQQLVTGVNASLEPGMSITGVVVDDQGSPLEGICVGATRDGDSPPVGWDSTGPDGTYSLRGLPVVEVRVAFVDCEQQGPFTMQWFDGVEDFGEATVLSPSAGQTITGIDAQMVPAASISGEVTDPGGNPIGGVCVQASTPDSFASSGETEGDGTYTLSLSDSGSYFVQFVDCNDTPEFAGTWWGGGLDPATADPVVAEVGNVTTGIDVVLQPASPGSISGTVANARGEALENVCAVAFVPDRLVRFAPTDENGDYDFPSLPSGTWTVGFLDCSVLGDEEPTPVVDPTTGVAYQGIWFESAVILIEGEGAPDPIAQGAEPVTLAPGGSEKIDMCFGCSAIEVTEVKLSGGVVTATFGTPGLATGNDAPSADAVVPSYTLSCTSSSGTVSSQPQAGSPISLAGLTGGETYQCSVGAAAEGLIVARSVTFEAVVEDDGRSSPETPPSGDPASGDPTPGGPTGSVPPSDGGAGGGSTSGPGTTDPLGDGGSNSPSAAPLAVTGAGTGSILLLAGASILLGALVLGLGAMTSRPTLGRRRL